MKITCVIIDDEPLALDLMERYVKNTSFLDCKGKYNSAIEALEIINSSKIDLVFLDIHMPELNGLEFSRILPKETRIIFTTAFNKYAIEGYKVNALDFLLKPFNYEEFFTASQKAKEWFDLNAKQNTRLIDSDDKKFIFVKSEYKQLKINLKEVLYFESLKDYVKIWIQNQQKATLTIMSLKSLEGELDQDSFMRIHRSFIISLNSIQSVERGRVLMTNGIYITVAEQYKIKFNEYISSKSIS